jgi:phosphoacetylglucosamine mutase
VVVDCANGVGAAKLKALAERLSDAGLAVDLRNTGDGPLNDGCGADYLQVHRQIPASFPDVPETARFDVLHPA